MSMVTPMLTQLLKAYASRFVESGSLRAESGDIYGDDLFLNCSVIEETIGEAIDQVELGVHINLIHCKRLKLEIPWSLLSFSNDVLELTIEEVTVVLGQQDPRQVSAEELRELKEARVREAMAQLLESVLMPAGAARESSKEKDGGGRRAICSPSSARCSAAAGPRSGSSACTCATSTAAPRARSRPFRWASPSVCSRSTWPTAPRPMRNATAGLA